MANQWIDSTAPAHQNEPIL